MKLETEARMLHMVGALLYHHAQYTNIPASKLLDEVVLPTIEGESYETQVAMVQLILRGEQTAHQVTTKLRARGNLQLVQDEDNFVEHKKG